MERITAGGMHLFTLAGKVQDAVNLVQPLLDPRGRRPAAEMILATPRFVTFSVTTQT
ncbi:hypothetical protein [Nonomuraea turcica]|uniref:hypothetical protein n=1 Tax=Nonomuraea sp. G32 TaxID=3067274 RepID=UPI00273CB9C0|nr:hypothetical protein [Nonomuraea sp. G32]MDP4512083.1 hypothetical protein [Nonomuraea sp. G32]